MAWIKDSKAASIASDAAKARDDGRLTFAAMLNTPMTHHTMSGGIDDWSVMVDAVEAEGWRVEHFTAAVDAKGKPQAYVLFRRVNSAQNANDLLRDVT